MNYQKIEQEALDFLNAQFAEITNWQRAWTNGGRREIQRLYDFPEALKLYPDEDAIGTTFKLEAGNRRLVMPATFKAFRSKRGDLWRVEGANGDHVPLERMEYEDIVERYDLGASGVPEAFHMTWSPDGSGLVTVDCYPKPSAETPLRAHAYFYLEDLPDGDVSSYEDFISRLDPFLVRDYIVREALIKLEMWDSASQLSQSMSNRALALQKDAKVRELERSGSLVPRLRVAERGTSREMGYPFWGKA